ncbi:MAG: NAD(P)/FAD-dependent oxidoreductase [Balneolaceae bacterium]
MSQQKEVVIIGGGFGGISAAKVLAKSDFEVTIIDKKNHHLFQPLLYQVATAALSPGDIAMPIRSIFSKSKNIRTLLGEVTAIDKEKNVVQLRSGETISFDYLVAAPGTVYNYFGNEEWPQHAPALKTIDNALSIREKILVSLEKADQTKDPKTRVPYLVFAIIGGGPTGVEMAGAIAEITKKGLMMDYKNISADETRIYLIEAAPRILLGYPDRLAEKAKTDLEKLGVSVLTDSPVTDIQKEGVAIGDRFIESHNIVWAAGVNTHPLVKTLQSEYDKMGRVKVNPDLTVPGHDHIFVIGDAAHFVGKDNDPLPPLAPVAIQQGRYAGNLIKKREKGETAAPFRYRDKGKMATIGRAKAVADIRGFKLSGVFAWLAWSFIHIFFLIGFRNRFRVFAEWTWYYFTFKRGVRLITGRYSENVDESDKKEILESG